MMEQKNLTIKSKLIDIQHYINNDKTLVVFIAVDN